MIAVSTRSADRDAQHIAEKDVVQVLIGLDFGEQDKAEPEHAGEHDAHHRVLFDPAILLEIAGHQRAGEAGREGADHQRNSEDESDDDARAERHGRSHRP